MNKIVVGIDSSKPSAAALDWAVKEAKLRGSTLDIVVTWDYPIIATAEPMLVPTPDRDALVHSAESTANRMIADAHLDDSGIAYIIHTPEGRPGEELVGLAADGEFVTLGA